MSKTSKQRITPKGGYFAISERCFVQLSHDPAYADVERDPIPAADAKRMEDGHIFEDLVSKKFKKAIKPTPISEATIALARRVTKANFNDTVEALAKKLRGNAAVWIPECDRSTVSKRSREALTVAALTAGARFIWNCRLPMAGDLISEPDFLVRAGTRRKSNGKFAYYPCDVKDARVLEGAKAAVKYPVSTLGKYSFEDAKLKVVSEGSPKKKHSMQLAHYHAHLEQLGFEVTGDVWGAILGREGIMVWRNLSEPTIKKIDMATGEKIAVSIIDHYLAEFADRKAVAEAAMDVDSDVLAVQEYKQACNSCEFRTVCSDDLVESDHITLLPGVTPLRAEAHYNAGIETRAALAALDWKTAKVIESGIDVSDLIDEAAVWGDPVAPVSDLVTSKSKAVVTALEEAGIKTVGDFAGLHKATAEAYKGIKASNLSKDIDTARVAKVKKVYLQRGVDAIDIPRADIELDVDMENDTNGIIYMWGTRLEVRTRKASIPGDGYRPFVTWGDNDDAGEAKAFADMWAWIKALITIADNAGLTFKAYYYTPAEDRCMRHLVKKHAGVPGIPTSEELEAFIASDHWVDLSIAVKNQLVWPTLDLSLKSVAKWARHSWRDTDASGDSSTVWHYEAVHGETEEIRDAARQRLLDYNEDDVVATWVLRDWLSKLSRARDPKSRVPVLSSLDSRFMRNRPTRRRKAARS